MAGASAATRLLGSSLTDTAAKGKTGLGSLSMAGMAVGAALLVGFGAAVKAAIDFESSFAGVRKTVDASEAEFQALAQGMRDLATEIPVNVNELNRIGEAAGQLGVSKGAILGFTETVAKLGVTTNIVGEDAAMAMARIANVMQTPQDEFDRMGATIVALGNAGASTEADIVQMAQRIAGAGAIVDMTEAEVLGFANALSSVGIEAQAGGTAISRVFIDIANAAASGGEDLDKFAKVAGMSSAEFSQAFAMDAAGAMTTFIEGLGRLDAAGENVFAILENLGLSEIRVRDALLRAAGAGDLFRESIELGSAAWEENTALNEEAAKRFGTTESKIQLAVNAVNDLAISIGEDLAPAVGKAAEGLGVLVGGIQTVGNAIDDISLRSWVSEWTGVADIVPKFTQGAVAALKAGTISVQELEQAIPPLNEQLRGIDMAGQVSMDTILRLAGLLPPLEDGAEGAGGALAEAGDNMAGAGANAGALATDLDEMGGEMEEAKSLADQLTDALTALSEIEITSEETAISFRDSLRGLTDTIKDGSTSLQGFSEEADANRSAILDAVDAALAHGAAVADQTGSLDKGAAATRRMLGEIVKTAGAAGLSEKAVREYIASLNLTPDQIKTTIRLLGMQEAQGAVDRFITANDGRVIGVRVQVQGTTVAAVGGGHQAVKHGGGFVGESGPRRLHGGGSFEGGGLRGDEEMVIGQRGERVLSRGELGVLRGILGSGGSVTAAQGAAPGGGDVYVDVGDVTINDGSDYQDLIGAIAAGVRRERLARSDL